ncbi:hypothetical protein M5C99_01240 [Acidovorax sp. NCPPB 2350]|nr:hypothetical protein M5C99_01240 [Acidovorax sp. NCPPB 2350]
MVGTAIEAGARQKTNSASKTPQLAAPPFVTKHYNPAAFQPDRTARLIGSTARHLPRPPALHCFSMSLISASRLASTARALLLASFGLFLTGCASVYVDTATREVPAADIQRPAAPADVRLTFEFQSQGAPNARATQLLTDQIRTQVAASGLFQEVRDTAGQGGWLHITLNNVPVTENAAQQGFVTGLTFGLAGSAVTDGYICTVKYLPPDGGPAVEASARHAIHTTLGNASAPANAVKSASMEDAVRTMVRQVVANALRDLSRDPRFQQP